MSSDSDHYESADDDDTSPGTPPKDKLKDKGEKVEQPPDDKGDRKTKEVKKRSPEPAASKPPPPLEEDNAGDGWDDGFDDWEETESPVKEIETPVTVQPNKTDQTSKPSTVPEESDFKQLADKLSALGERRPAENQSSGGWGGWGGWGVNLISSGVSQFTSHVSQGISTVTDVLESGIGIPNPEELARSRKAKEDSVDPPKVDSDDNVDTPSEKKDEGFGVFKLDSIVSNVSKIVEKTAQSAVVVGGLDTLEEIGKRTMRVLQGEDEGKKRLSTLLREARDRAEQNPPSDGSSEVAVEKIPAFETLFDDFQGLVHLEALEMLSKQCEIKIQNLMQSSKGSELSELKETLNQVKDICELTDPDEEDENDKVENLDSDAFKEKLIAATADLAIALNFNNVVDCWRGVCEFCKNVPENDDVQEVTQKEIETINATAISKLAESSALSVQLLHRTTALLATRERRSTVDEADGLTQLTNTLMSWISGVSALYTQRITKMAKNDDSNKTSEIITNIFLEAEKGSSYVKDAFLLTIPIVQVGAT